MPSLIIITVILDKVFNWRTCMKTHTHTYAHAHAHTFCYVFLRTNRLQGKCQRARRSVRELPPGPMNWNRSPFVIKKNPNKQQQPAVGLQHDPHRNPVCVIPAPETWMWSTGCCSWNINIGSESMWKACQFQLRLNTDPPPETNDTVHLPLL